MTTSLQNRLNKLSDSDRAALAELLRVRLATERSPGSWDVIVLGGGVAGLCLALQLRQTLPSLRIAVVERQTHPVPETIHKVGESTVEIAAHYLRDVLGLGDHLESSQIRKFGLRMFFSGGDNTDIAQRVELGSSTFPPLSTYQLDRGRLENELAARCTQAGIELLAGTRVVEVELRPNDALHNLTLAGPQGEMKVHARWVVDASGRSQILQRQQHGQRKEVAHRANAAWLRVGHQIDIGSWTNDPEWGARILEGDRAMSTNHLMGPGYWVWLIRLASGSTSVGIVANADAHAFSDFNTLDKALAWLRLHEPQCAAVLQEHLDDIQDFRVMRDYSYSCDQVFSGDQRWCLTGEAGVFLDPLYSPGLDTIAISNTLVADLITRSFAGEDVSALAAGHDGLFRGVAEIWLAIYNQQYSLMGNAQVMSSKVIWDTAFYWGVFGLLFFQGQFTRAATTPSIASDLGRLAQISNRVQQFFREWESIDDSELPPQFVDLYAPIDFMVKLHAGMADGLTDSEFEARLTQNTRLFEQLAGQLVSKVIETFAERTHEDAVVERIQNWQRDPTITEFLAVYRKERHRNPTSSAWMTIGSLSTGPKQIHGSFPEIESPNEALCLTS